MFASYSISFLFLFLLAGQGGEESTLRNYEHEIPAALQAWVKEHAPGTNLRTSRIKLAAAKNIPRPDLRFRNSTIDLNPANPLVMVQAGGGSEVYELRKENEELKARLDRLEKLLEGGSKTTTTTTEPAKEPVTETANPDMTTLPGWLVELHPWRKDLQLSADAKRTMVLENCEFTGTLGATNDMEMSIYRFQGIFQAKDPGRYAFAMDTTCGFGHGCQLSYSVDNNELIRFSGQTETRLMEGLALEPGNHKLSFVITLMKSNFLKYSPDQRFKWKPMVKAPNDLNFRDFTPEELFVQIPRNANMGSRRC